MKPAFKFIYGPVPSWRLGASLGIDLLSQEEKICNFDCAYCQLGATKRHAIERKIYVPVEKVIEEIEALPDVSIDYITFSGRGECALAANLGKAIKAVKLIRKEQVAVLTNSALIGLEEVRKELVLADFVIAKLDVFSAEAMREINNPAEGVEFSSIVEGAKEFRKNYMGKLALQIMFLENNKQNINEYAYLINCISPDEVQINTPLRHSALQPLTKEDIFKIRDYFVRACKGIDIISVYDEKMPKVVHSISDKDTLRRRGKLK